MPHSSEEGKVDTAEWVKKIDAKTVLDIGPGAGRYSDLFKENNITFEKINSVEVWEPYVSKYGLLDKYDNVFIEDARNWEDFNYDLIIFGDVLEHMTKEEAISLWNKAKKHAKYAVISIPIIHYHQDDVDGNPYERHIKEDWSTGEVLETFENITSYKEYPVVGVFYASFM